MYLFYACVDSNENSEEEEKKKNETMDKIIIFK